MGRSSLIDNKTFIIAEGGVNHNGSLEVAKNLVDAAKDCGADGIKFQTFKAKEIVSKYAKKAEYQRRNLKKGGSQLEMLEKLQLSFNDFDELFKYCKEKKILFLSSPFDLESIDFLASLGMEIFKIPSGEITNLPYLEKIGRLKKKVILSTGMANLKEIKDALDILIKEGTKKEDIWVLHCTTEYPAPIEEVNLKAMITIRDKFNVKVGFSDHTLGIEVPIAAVALGAKVIEKHFTLDKNMEGPDHKASLEPEEFKRMVFAIRNIENALGDGKKIPTLSERKNIPIVRKSIVAKRDIKKGEIFTEENITVKRPGTGLSPMNWYKIIGKKAKRDYKEDELI